MSDYKNILLKEIQDLRDKIEAVQMPPELSDKLKRDVVALERSVELGSYDEKYEKVSRYVDLVLRIPFGKTTDDNLDINRAKEIFNKHHYGLESIKNRFLEFVSVMNLRNQAEDASNIQSTVLLLVGLVGTGKTTFAYSLSEALGRKLIRIPFGGLSNVAELKGNSRLILGSEPGKLIKGVCDAGVMNPVFLLDEVDRIGQDALADIMGVLVELLDPAQNHSFVDSYVDFPVNLSKAIFLATANNTVHITTAVMDRMEKLSMPSYSDQEKMKIGKDYILPDLLKTHGVRPDQFVIKDDVWQQIVRPLGFDAGVRTLRRNLESAIRKAARIIIERGFKEVIITKDNIKIFIPRY